MIIENQVSLIGPAPGPEAYHVAFCADKHYLQHLGVAAFSLLINNASKPLALTVVADQVDDVTFSRLRVLAATFCVPISVYRVDQRALGALGTSGHISTASYYRLLLPTLLPESVDRVLYLDSDLIVDADLSELMLIDLNDHDLAACVDCIVETTRYSHPRQGGEKRYFNSGVMLMNLARWREAGIHSRALKHAVNVGKKLQYADQDALNAVVGDGVRLLDPKWNYMVFSKLRKDLQQQLSLAQTGVDRPTIVHFTGAIKPWHAWCSSRYKGMYNDYRRVSPWRHLQYPERPSTHRQFMWAAEVAESEGRTAEALALYREALTHSSHDR